MQARVVPPDAARRPAAAADQSVAPFHVFVRTPAMAERDAGLVAAVLEELAAVWKANGIEVVACASDLAPTVSEMSSRATATVTLILAQTVRAAAPRGPLGWVEFLGDASPLPVIHVSLPTAHALIDRASLYGTHGSLLPRHLRDRLLVRVLGRAAAHELGHYLLASRGHAPTGLMRARFTPQEWFGDQNSAFRLRSDERAMLAARMRDARSVAVARDE
jgi:hypothetical protein